MKKKQIISIIVTCYNEEKNIEPLYKRIKKIFSSLSSYDYELIYVDNVSKDTSEEVFRRLAKKDKRVKVILMSRNNGSPQPSFVAGLSYATGDAAVLLHGDIQDPPEMIPDFLKYWKKGYDVVYGVRTHRKGYGFLWNFYYKAFYFVLRKLAYIDIPRDAGEFSLISRRVIDSLLALPEYDFNVRCLRAFVGYPQHGIDYVRDERKEGVSTVNFFIAFLSAQEMIFNFSFKPILYTVLFGLFLMTVSALGIVLSVVFSLIGTEQVILPLWGFILIFLSGVQLFCLGAIGVYVSKIFLEVKDRPRYIIRETLNLNNRHLASSLKEILQHKQDFVTKRPITQHL